MGSAGLGERDPSLSSGPLPLETVLKELAPGIQQGHNLEFWNSKDFKYVVTGSLMKRAKLCTLQQPVCDSGQPFPPSVSFGILSATKSRASGPF